MAEENKGGDSIVTKCKNIPWDKVVRVIGGICGLLLVILGIISIITFSGFNIKTLVNNIYQIIFGLLMMLAEVRYWRALDRFSFLKSYTGLGMFYVFVGGLALGGDWYEIVLAIIMCAVGIYYLMMACARKQLPGVNDSAQKGTEMQGAKSSGGNSAAVVTAAAAGPISSNTNAAGKEVEESAWPEEESSWPSNNA